MQANLTSYSEGQRITARGEDFMITSVRPMAGGYYLLQARGLSELVKERYIPSILYLTTTSGL